MAATTTDPTMTTTTASTVPMIAPDPSPIGPPDAGGSWDGMTAMPTVLWVMPDRSTLSVSSIDGKGVDTALLEGTLSIDRPENTAEEVTKLLISSDSEAEKIH